MSEHLNKKQQTNRANNDYKHPTIFEVQTPRIMQYSQFRNNDKAERELKLLEIGSSRATKVHMKKVN